jgi:hypothetical protein
MTLGQVHLNTVNKQQKSADMNTVVQWMPFLPKPVGKLELCDWSPPTAPLANASPIK